MGRKLNGRFLFQSSVHFWSSVFLNQALCMTTCCFWTQSCWPLNLHLSSLLALSIGPEIGSNEWPWRHGYYRGQKFRTGKSIILVRIVFSENNELNTGECRLFSQPSGWKLTTASPGRRSSWAAHPPVWPGWRSAGTGWPAQSSWASAGRSAGNTGGSWPAGPHRLDEPHTAWKQKAGSTETNSLRSEQRSRPENI